MVSSTKSIVYDCCPIVASRVAERLKTYWKLENWEILEKSQSRAQWKQSAVSNLPSRYKTPALVVKNFAKTDIKVFLVLPSFAGFFDIASLILPKFVGNTFRFFCISISCCTQSFTKITKC